MKIKAFFIFLVISAAFVLIASYTVYSALRGETNFDIMADVFFPCKAKPIIKSGRMAVIRVDDIQAFGWAQISKKIIDDSYSRDIPLVLGVIPKNLKEDAGFYKFLRKNRCHFEIAQHGWEHNEGDDGVTPEFRGKTKKEAYEMINKGKSVIEALSRKKVLTFIPPNNEYSEGTKEALNDLKIPVVSAEGGGYFDMDISFYDYRLKRLNFLDEIVSACENKFMRSNFCVIMLHPQDFADGSNLNENKYKVYIDLLDKLKKSGVSFVRFEDLR